MGTDCRHGGCDGEGPFVTAVIDSGCTSCGSREKERLRGPRSRSRR